MIATYCRFFTRDAVGGINMNNCALYTVLELRKISWGLNFLTIRARSKLWCNRMYIVYSWPPPQYIIWHQIIVDCSKVYIAFAIRIIKLRIKTAHMVLCRNSWVKGAKQDLVKVDPNKFCMGMPPSVEPLAHISTLVLNRLGL